jgi:hypothetical protein
LNYREVRNSPRPEYWIIGFKNRLRTQIQKSEARIFDHNRAQAARDEDAQKPHLARRVRRFVVVKTGRIARDLWAAEISWPGH